jgi:hypothetical protein
MINNCEEVVAGEVPAAPPIKKLARVYSSWYLAFWANYPARVGKGAAWASWLKAAQYVGGEAKLLDLCAAAVTRQLRTRTWLEGFVPMPATYLNQRRWEDEDGAQ